MVERTQVSRLLRPAADRRENARDSDANGWRQEAKDLVRGVAAGAIVGMPLLYTMEMWFHGMLLSPAHQLVLLGAVLLVNFLFNLFSGFRHQPGFGHLRRRAMESAAESCAAVALGLIFSLAILLLIGEITFRSSFVQWLGRVLIEAGPVSIGVCFANSQVRKKAHERQGHESGEEDEGHARDVRDDGGAVKEHEHEHEDENEHDEEKDADDRGAAHHAPSRQLQQDLKDIAATISGATIFGFNVAPTEEVLMISSRLAAWQHLIMLAAALVLCYLILFASDFREHQVHVQSIFQRPIVEVCITCGLSLVVSFVLLALVGEPDTTAIAANAVQCTVVLGLLTCVGGSAGRLIV